MKKIIFISKIAFLIVSLMIIPLALIMAPALLSQNFDSQTTNIGYGYLFLLIALSSSSFIIIKGLLKKENVK